MKPAAPSVRARRGAVMIVVLGLIAILLSLALGVTVKVYNGIKNSSNVTLNAQAWIMMQAARMCMSNEVYAGDAPYAAEGTVGTIGNLPTAAIPDKALADRLGWAHIKQVNLGATAYWQVVAVGGSSGQGELKASAIDDGDPVRNAMDVRYVYELVPSLPLASGDPLVAGSLKAVILKAATEAYTATHYW